MINIPEEEIHTPLPKEIQDLNNQIRNKGQSTIKTNNNSTDKSGEYVSRPRRSSNR